MGNPYFRIALCFPMRVGVSHRRNIPRRDDVVVISLDTNLPRMPIKLELVQFWDGAGKCHNRDRFRRQLMRIESLPSPGEIGHGSIATMPFEIEWRSEGCYDFYVMRDGVRSKTLYQHDSLECEEIPLLIIERDEDGRVVCGDVCIPGTEFLASYRCPLDYDLSNNRLGVMDHLQAPEIIQVLI